MQKGQCWRLVTNKMEYNAIIFPQEVWPIVAHKIGLNLMYLLNTEQLLQLVTLSLHYRYSKLYYFVALWIQAYLHWKKQEPETALSLKKNHMHDQHSNKGKQKKFQNSAFTNALQYQGAGTKKNTHNKKS